MICLGFSYEYLSPDNFALPEAYVQNRFLAPDRQQFKAMVVEVNEILTGLGVSKLLEFAIAGLPIIFYGGLPSRFHGYNQKGHASANVTLSHLILLPNVRIIPPGQELADALAEIKVTPRAAVKGNANWFTTWRSDSFTEYVYVFNIDEIFSSGFIKVETIGIPYLYDAWTGNITPIIAYKQSPTHTTIPLRLAGSQSIILAFKHSVRRNKGLHVLSDCVPASILDIRPGSSSNT